MKKKSPFHIVVKWRKPKNIKNYMGSWKIAYADFMTAMMAFFLLMWVLSSTTQQQKEQIADYFKTPLKDIILNNRKSFFDKREFEINKKIIDKNINFHLCKKDIQDLENFKNKLILSLKKDLNKKKIKPNINIDITNEGLRIEIMDIKNRPMFDIGKSELAPYMQDFLHILAPIINDTPYYISLEGHTDNKKYFHGEHGYSNWELSTDRANSSRRALIEGGLNSNKIVRIIGMANTLVSQKNLKNQSSQRRISILLLNNEQEKNIFDKQVNILNIN